MNSTTAEKFVKRLRSFKNNAGAMAKMRSFVRADNYQACSVVEPLIPEFITSEWERKCMYTVACFFAHHSTKLTKKWNFGKTMQGTSRNRQAAEQRVCRLLSCSGEDILDVLYHEILHAKSAGAFINYPQLLTDLVYWGDAVKRRWAVCFYRRKSNKTSNSEGGVL